MGAGLRYDCADETAHHGPFLWSRCAALPAIGRCPVAKVSMAAPGCRPMARWLFPIGLVLILLGAAFAYWEAPAPQPGTATGSTRTPAREASPNPGGDAGAPTAPVPQTSGGSGQ